MVWSSDQVLRSSGLAKKVLRGTLKGKRKKGRRSGKRYERVHRDGPPASSIRAAENITVWIGIVVK